jgi:hypothetical protein
LRISQRFDPSLSSSKDAAGGRGSRTARLAGHQRQRRPPWASDPLRIFRIERRSRHPMLKQHPPARSLPSLHPRSVLHDAHPNVPQTLAPRPCSSGQPAPRSRRNRVNATLPISESTTTARCRFRALDPLDTDHVAHNNELARAFARSPDPRAMRISHHRQSNRCRSSPSVDKSADEAAPAVLANFRHVFCEYLGQASHNIYCKMSILLVHAISTLTLPFHT